MSRADVAPRGMRVSLAHSLAPWLTRLLVVDDLDRRVIVACSGGADSLALLALARARRLETVAVHVDHGLRPTSGHDADVVARAAEQLGATVHIERVDIELGPNLEARARLARYAALESARRRTGAAAVLVAHTRDDQAETVLLNLLRGSATPGLAGIAVRRDPIRRPLLDLRRADTVEICRRLGLTPVHDAMNDDLAFRRVWVRRELMPILEAAAERDLVDVLARQAALLREDDELLNELAREAVPVEDTLDARALTRVSTPLARRAVRRWLGGPPPSLEHLDAVLAVARGDRRAVDLPGGRRIERVGRQLHLVSRPGPAPRPATWALPGQTYFGSFVLDAWIERGAPVAWPDGRTTVVLDADRLGDSVMLRAPIAGDRIHPAGASGRKLVADALGEIGVAASDRARRPVVVDPESDEVCWVVGYRIGERVAVTSRTRRFLWMSANTSPPAVSLELNPR
jgi:tRNA(Ile)-lysidine synthase